MNSKIAIVVSITILLTAMGFLIYTGLNANMVYYFRVDEFLPQAQSLSNETVKINGIVASASIHKQGMNYDFLVSGTGKNQVHVSYTGVVPDTFREGSEVVVEGKYDAQSKVFRCATLLAKCPSKYESRQQNTQKT